MLTDTQKETVGCFFLIALKILHYIVCVFAVWTRWLPSNRELHQQGKVQRALRWMFQGYRVEQLSRRSEKNCCLQWKSTGN